LGTTQLDATASVAGAFSYSPAAGTVLSTAGTTTLSVTFTPTDTTDYNTATASVSLTVTAAAVKTTPTLTWATPAPVPVGTTLGATQLDASASVPGAFTYSPAAGTVLSTAGTTTLSVTFTPTDTADYNTATSSVSLAVTSAAKTTPTITWATPTSVTSGSTLSSTQLNATASVPGTFTYQPAAGAELTTDGSVTLSATFTPTDTADYNSTSATVSLAVTSPSSEPAYSWTNVKIVAGGYVPGLYFHPTQKGLMYARTDMGGAYRWGPNDTEWVPLLDWVSPANYQYGGPEAIGLDPTDPNRLYIAVGEYAQVGHTSSWDGNGAMMVSQDQGNTFTTIPLSFQNGSNDDGRNAGERIAVDANSPNIVYFGTRRAGLQISTDHGSTWNQVTGLPVTATANSSGIVSVVPVASSGSSGSATPAVYVAVAGTGVTTNGVTDPVGLYVTTTGGSTTGTWAAVTGQPSFATATTPLAPLHAVLGPNGNLYVLYADGAGPNNISTSQLWEFTPGSSWTSGTWKQITLPPNSGGNTGESGYGGIAIDPSHAGVLLLSTIDQWWPGDTIYRSTNDGQTWKDVGAKGGTHDATLSPYLAYGSGNVTNVGSGNWAGSIVIDPFNPDHAMYGTGGTIWATTNLTSADSSKTVDWTVGANGLEEASIGMAIAPPSGKTILLSGMGDIYGFAHTDLTVSPVQGMYSNPRYYPSDMDFEQNTPMTVVRATQGNAANVSKPTAASNTPWGTISTDGGLTWTGFAGSPSWTDTTTGSASGGGSMAVARDGSSIVWTPLNTTSAWYSTNQGATWTAATGLPAQAQVVSDRVAAGVFYGFSGGTLYLSTDGGATWNSQQSGLPTNCSSQTGCLVILPDAQGDLWLASKSGLYHNTGTATAPNLTSLSGVSAANYLSFGQAAAGSSYLTLYLYGTANNSSTSELFRSVDNGVTWTQLNDGAHQWGGGVNSVTGDMRTFGTVYVGTNGRGILWGTSTN
jgi:hypothetical protein